MRVLWFVGAVTSLALLATPPPIAFAAQAPRLRIVVISGEDAVNVIQQNTAVAPVVEVRDSNDQPVAGAVVTFAIRQGRATFNGARTLQVTTNALGRAGGIGMTPTGTGALRISASAAFQGQTAVATIAQTTVLTAAQAAASTSGLAAGTGATTGGGLSNTAILGVIGAGAAGTAVVVTTVGDETPPPPTTVGGTFAAQYSMAFTTTLSSGSTSTCTHSRTVNGTISMTLQEASDGTVSGTASITTAETVVAVSATCSPANMVIGTTRSESWTASLSGPAGALSFSIPHPHTSTPFSGGSVTGTRTLAFSGGLSSGVVSGTATLIDAAVGTTQGNPLVWDGRATASVTLR